MICASSTFDNFNFTTWHYGDNTLLFAGRKRSLSNASTALSKTKPSLQASQKMYYKHSVKIAYNYLSTDIIFVKTKITKLLILKTGFA